MNDHAELTQKFIASFEAVEKNLDRAELEPLYAKLPARFSPLYEELILSYRWADVDLQSFTLLANPPGDGLSRLFQRISGDKGLWETLIPKGYIPFGKGTDIGLRPCVF